MSPRQRSKRKKILSVYVDQDLKSAMEVEAKRTGQTLTALATQFYIDALSRRGVEIKKEGTR